MPARLKKDMKTEIEALKVTNGIAAKRLLSVRKSALRDADHIGSDLVTKIKQEIAVSPTVQKLYDMRCELSMLWQRSNLSREELLAHLRDWVERAEQSGIEALQVFALQLRSYR